jgi:two-component system cell cycle sensor histidine kinase/response regulator CckA
MGSTAEATAKIAMMADISELQQAEKERDRLIAMLAHSQKLEAIGTLAGGVAHDFNNILGGVMVGLSLLERRHADERHRTLIADMKALVERGAKLTQQLLGFSGRGKYEAAPRDVREIIGRTTALFQQTHRGVQIAEKFASDVDNALIDSAQIEQVLLNLYLNAAQAMPGGGCLEIGAQNRVLSEEEALPLGVAAGRFVQIAVGDTGTGIDAAILPHIFEPFFTTKAPDQGTGLGLASAYGIVRNHGGSLHVESVVGAGTTFFILLPATEQRSTERPTTPLGHGGRGTILIVDDEEQILRMSAELLCDLGYDVLTASSGRRAVELVREHHDAIAWVILDLTMPEMSGAATFDAMRAEVPTVKVLVASGFTIDGMAQTLLDRGCCGFVQKPFDIARLAAELHSFK